MTSTEGLLCRAEGSGLGAEALGFGAKYFLLNRDLWDTYSFLGVGFDDITPVMENQIDQKMEHEMETGF